MRGGRGNRGEELRQLGVFLAVVASRRKFSATSKGQYSRRVSRRDKRRSCRGQASACSRGSRFPPFTLPVAVRSPLVRIGTDLRRGRRFLFCAVGCLLATASAVNTLRFTDLRLVAIAIAPTDVGARLKPIVPAAGAARSHSVDCDHPAIRGAVIAFMVERSPRPVRSPDETDRQRGAAHTTASGAPATVELAAPGLVLAGEPLALAIGPSLLWQPGGLGRTGGSAPLVAGSRAREAVCRSSGLHMQGASGGLG